MPPTDRATTVIARLRRLRRPEQPPVGRDLTIGVLLFLALGVFYLVRLFSLGMHAWAGQVTDGTADRTADAQLGFTWHLMGATFGFAALAALLRARWTAAVLVLAALVLSTSAAQQQHAWDRGHPAPPTPLPTWYTPCYSGSGRCN
ncbi:DUF6234 family protein [Kitasatospora sp. NPDC059146]|uniref:DUF6234 family protein n=1 Tax=unclassified Kitasatospora TaxID=2633591 RepID=UPI0036944521